MSTPQPAQSGPPLRALAMVLIALAIAFAGIGAMSLSDSESDAQAATDVVPSVAPVSAAPNSPAASTRPTTTVAPTTSAAVTTTVAAADKSSVPVRVFNNSTVSGLAAQTASTLESGGWTVSETGNYSTGTVPSTTVYYTANSASEKRVAEEIADELGVGAQPRFSGIESASPGVIVIVAES